MFNGEVEHPESPKDEVESEQTTPSKTITELDDFKPTETPGDPQVRDIFCDLLFNHF